MTEHIRLPDEMCAEEAVAIHRLYAERDELRAEVGRLRAEIDHWKETLQAALVALGYARPD